jgi:rhodanese-related sulfurtransferase
MYANLEHLPGALDLREATAATTRPGGDMPGFIEREEVRRLVDEGAQLVEVLGRPQYEEEHLPGAVNIFLRAIAEKAPAELDRSRPVIVYCQDTL